MNRPRVLIVDDNRANLLALSAVLADGCDLVTATSGAGAIQVLEAGRDVDVILLDVHMPGMDGFETAKRIKQMERGANIPIVFITAIYQEDPYVRRGYEVGGIDYIPKPFDPDILRAKVGIYAAHRCREAVLEARERQLRESEALLQLGRRLSSIVESLPVGDATWRKQIEEELEAHIAKLTSLHAGLA
jgi:CheY-like chemotaxis protein